MAELDLKKRYFKIKRKLSQEIVFNNKRCKFIGSTPSPDNDNIQKVIQEKEDINSETINFHVKDYQDFLEEFQDVPGFPRIQEKIACNDVEMVPTDDGFIYDIYEYHLAEDDFSQDESNFRYDDEEVDSNDEDHPYNDYPDEDEHDYRETNYYKTWEYDDEREMLVEFEKSNINGDSDDDFYGQFKSSDSDEETSENDEEGFDYDDYLKKRKQEFDNELEKKLKILENA